MAKYTENKQKIKKNQVKSGFIKKKQIYTNKRALKRKFKYEKNLKDEFTIVPEKEFSEKKCLLDEDNSEILEEFSGLLSKYKKRSMPHVQSGSDWVSQLISEQTGYKPIPFSTRRKIKGLAQKIYEDDVEAYKTIQQKQGEHKKGQYYEAVLSHGTSKDKMAALAYVCMESPVYSTKELFQLLEFISLNNKSSYQAAIDDISSLFHTTLIPGGFVAKEFDCHDFRALIPLIKNNFEQVEKQLVLWYFESLLQQAYLKFIDNIDRICYDTTAKLKSAGIKGLQMAIKNNPNQEAELVVRKLINKLGDPSKGITGELVYVLGNIQTTHKKLKTTVISLIEELLYRQNISSRAQYYGLCLLKDVIFDKHDKRLAEKLIKIYVDFFQVCSGKGEVDSSFMSAILRGLNRAYPYIEEKRLQYLEDQINVLYKLCHLANFNIATQAMQLLYQLSSPLGVDVSDRFYSTLYSKLLDPSFVSSSLNAAFLNLVFKSLVRDHHVNRVCAFVRRLLQVCVYQAPNLVCGTLYLVSEAIRDNPHLQIPKLLLMSEKVVEEKVISDSEDDLEYYPDVDDDEGDSSETGQIVSSEAERDSKITTDKKPPVKLNKVKSESSWLHRDNYKLKDRSIVRTAHYDPKIRNPLFCGADLSPIFELQSFQNHFHPTVSLFVNKLLSQNLIEYSGDPLEDFTLIRFLNRFTQRNPKKIQAEKNKSAAVLGSRAYYQPKGARSIAVGSEKFRNMKKDAVAVEDLFFHNYFTKYRKEKKTAKKTKDEEDSEDDDEFDDYLDRMSQFNAGDDDNDFEGIDFAKNAIAVGEYGGEDDEEEEEEDEDEMDDMEEEDYGENDDSLEDDDIEEEDFSDDELDDEYMPTKKLKAFGKKAKSSGDWRDKLVDADEFNQILEANGDFDDPFAGTSEAVSNKDGAHKKQLLWERNRRGDSSNPKGKKNFNSKRTAKESFKGLKGNFKAKKKAKR